MINSALRKPQTVEEYIFSFPSDVQLVLKNVRKAIKESAPEAEESIGYQMPAYKLQGPLVYFAGYKKHIGFYPTPSGIEKFSEELAQYKGAKGSVQFPLDKPIPYNLIKKIVAFRVKENLQRAR